MDRWMTPEINRILPILGIGIISFSVIIGLLARKIRSSFKPFSRKAVIYLLVALLLFGFTALVVAAGFFNTYTGYFIFFQVLFMLYGSLHVYLMKMKMDWGRDERSFWPDVLYSFLIMVAGALVFALIYRLVNREGLELPMMTSVLFFIIPVIVVHTFKKAMEIPPRVLKQWYYPVHQPVEDPDENKLKNLLLISFEFQKKSDDAWFTNFRAKAPTDMELGTLFYYFINDYNEQHPQARIHYTNANGEPYGWMFYKKPRWYTILTGYMDADKTIFINTIRENDIIVCARIY